MVAGHMAKGLGYAEQHQQKLLGIASDYRCGGYRSGESWDGTIAFPIGHSASPASFRCAQANGMPTTVTASRIAVTR
jgi:hypothetical protein